jgi:nitrilase
MTGKLCKAVREAKINVIFGLHKKNTETSNYTLYNSLLFIDEKGKILGKHRKLIPTGGERMI